MVITYVILHYMAFRDTIECADSILNSTCDSEHKTRIVIVDNGSTNDSYNILTEKYLNNDIVSVLHSESNLGFARGNNLGFVFAKKTYNSDFIVLLNNDTLISQSNINELIVKKYKENGYYVLGPDIVTIDGYHQNPISDREWSKSKLICERIKKRVRILLYLLHLEKIAITLQKNKKDYLRIEAEKQDIKDIMLHGACMIFSKPYIDIFDGLDDRTFLYMEEDILHLYAKKYEFLMMYTSEIRILHKEDVSTNMSISNTREKEIFYCKNIINSSKVYERVKRELTDEKKCI